MPEPIIGDCTQYKFATTEEELAAFVFTEVQLAGLRTMLSDYVQARAMLSLDHELPNAEKSFVFASERLLGRIETLQLLLNTHASNLAALQELATTRTR